MAPVAFFHGFMPSASRTEKEMKTQLEGFIQRVEPVGINEVNIFGQADGLSSKIYTLIRYPHRSSHSYLAQLDPPINKLVLASVESSQP